MQSEKLVWIAAAILCLCIVVWPVNAAGEIVEQGGTVFIGEQGLDLTHAVNGGYATGDPDGLLPYVHVGLFTDYPANQGFLEDTPPGDMNLTTSSRYQNYMPTPPEFAGHVLASGNDVWSIHPSLAGSDHMGSLSPAYRVADPWLGLTIWNSAGGNLTGASAPQGTKIRFKINTNMYQAVDPTYRSPLNPATDGYINIFLRDNTGTIYTQVYNYSAGYPDAGPHSLNNNYVDTGDWNWGENGDFFWNTGIVDGTNNYVYPPGMYSVWAESTLHGMKDNYKNGGADYLGKTVTGQMNFVLTAGPAPSDLSVSSIPSGARIWVDGIDTGQSTDSALLGVLAGSHTVTVKLAGYHDATVGTTVASGSHVVLAPLILIPDSVTLDPPVADAVQKIITTELGSDVSNVAVSAYPHTVPANAVIGLWGSNSVSFSNTGSCSLVAVDEDPVANWEHPITYYCVNADGTYQSGGANSPSTNYPFTYALGMSPTPGEDWHPDDPYVWQQACVNDCSKNYAILIDGGVNKDNNYRRYWNDIAFMYNTLIEYGYAPSHITVLMSDGDTAGNPDRYIGGTNPYDDSPRDLTGDGVNETIFTATKNQIIANLTWMQPTKQFALPQDANLFIFTTGHGGLDTSRTPVQSTMYAWGGAGTNQYLNESELNDYLNALSQVKSITLVMENCYAGGFSDTFIGGAGIPTGQKRYLITASSATEPSYGNGFSDAFTTGIAGHTRYFTRLCTRESCPGEYEPGADTTVDQRVSMAEAFAFGVLKDPYVRIQENPTHAETSGADPSTQFTTVCTAAATPAIFVTVPTGGAKWQAGTSHTIFWRANGLAGKHVNINLLKSGAQSAVIASSVDATAGQADWFISPSQATSTSNVYSIQITTTDMATAQISNKSDGFQIAAKPTTGGTFAISTKDDLGTFTGASGFIWNGSTKWAGTSGLTTFTTPTLYALGDYDITLTKTGYYPFTTIATLSSGTNTKSYTMYAIPTGANGPLDLAPYGGLDVSSNPDGARIFVDGKDTGRDTPTVIYIEPGSHSVYVTKDGYEQSATNDVMVEIRTPDRVPAKVTFTLAPASWLYTIDGFNSPIDMNGTLNTAKAGQTVPVKWHLANRDGNVVNPSSFVKFWARQINCGEITAGADAIEQYSTGGSGLQNLGSGNWQYNWKTDRTFKNCYAIYVEFDHGQKSNEAYFKFA